MKKILTKITTASREVWLSLFSAFFLIAIWEAAIDLGWVNSVFFVAPSTIITVAVKLIRNGELLPHIFITLTRMFAGFFTGSTIGLIVGLVMGWSKTVRALLNPLISVIYPLPKVALLPLFMLIVGVGERPIIMIIALSSFFPVLVNSIAGVRNIDQIYFDAAQNYGASNFKIFIKVILPGSLPIVFSGIRLALGISLLTTVVLELAVATNGLGAILWLSWATLRVERIYVAIAVIALIGLILNPFLNFIERYLIPWKEEQ